MEAGIGAEGVQNEGLAIERHQGFAVLGSLLQPGYRPIVVSRSHVDDRQIPPRDVVPASSPLKPLQNPKRLLLTTSEPQCPPEKRLRYRITSRQADGLLKSLRGLVVLPLTGRGPPYTPMKHMVVRVQLYAPPVPRSPFS